MSPLSWFSACGHGCGGGRALRWLVAQAVWRSGDRALGSSRPGTCRCSADFGTLIGRPLRDRVTGLLPAGTSSDRWMPTAIHAESSTGRRYRQRGVDTIKVRIGVDWEDHLERARRTLHVTSSGPDMAIGVDGNEAFQGGKTSLRHCRANWQTSACSFFEEPMPRDQRSNRSGPPCRAVTHTHRVRRARASGGRVPARSKRRGHTPTCGNPT